ncbi:MAG: hypothetical protein PVI88_00190 [Nitrosopumilaceae archaeon]|jgi:hypothetical protein
MAAYGTIDEAIRGLKYGLGPDGRIEGGWACKEADGIEFGDPVFGYVGDNISCYKFKNDVGKIVFDADFEASNVITITVNSVAAADVTFTTDHDTTAGLVVDAINALTGVKAVLDSTDTDNRTFLIQTKGQTAVVAEAVTGGSGQPDGTITYGSSQVFLGVALFSQNQPKLYEQYDAVNVMADGELWVEPVATVYAGQAGYVDNAATDIGEFSNAGVEINGTYRSNATSGNLARLRVLGQKQMTYAGLFV